MCVWTRKHVQEKFFKDRHYLFREFPGLTPPDGATEHRVLEVCALFSLPPLIWIIQCKTMWYIPIDLNHQQSNVCEAYARRNGNASMMLKCVSKARANISLVVLCSCVLAFCLLLPRSGADQRSQLTLHTTNFRAASTIRAYVLADYAVFLFPYVIMISISWQRRRHTPPWIIRYAMYYVLVRPDVRIFKWWSWGIQCATQSTGLPSHQVELQCPHVARWIESCAKAQHFTRLPWNSFVYIWKCIRLMEVLPCTCADMLNLIHIWGEAFLSDFTIFFTHISACFEDTMFTHHNYRWALTNKTVSVGNIGMVAGYVIHMIYHWGMKRKLWFERSALI